MVRHKMMNAPSRASENLSSNIYTEKISDTPAPPGIGVNDDEIPSIVAML